MGRGCIQTGKLSAALCAELGATARASKTTLPGRSVIACVGSAMMETICGPVWAVCWLVLIAGLEAALHGLAAYRPRDGEDARYRAASFVVLVGLISLTWSAGPILFWSTGRPVLQFAGLAIIMAQLIDVQCYTFRLRFSSMILGVAPLALLIILPLRSSFLEHDTLDDRAILTFCLCCAGAYSVAALRENRLAADRLEASNLAAQAASRAKSAFVAMISHELRTPMNGVLGLAHALKSARSSIERESQIELIVRSGETLMALLNDILDLSKVEASKVDIQKCPFDAKALLDEILALWGPLAQEKGLAFSCRIEPDQSLWLLGDEARLRQILGNLVSNAIKFTAAGQVSLLLTIGEEGEAGSPLTAQVSDSGIGMSINEQAGLFEPFAQANAAISGAFGGTGLGLAISRGLVEAMGGKLAVTSHPERGSTFTLRLTLPRTTPPAPASIAATVQRLDQTRVLVVDDNAINLHVATALLLALGACPTTAAGGVEALALLGEASFDVVLMDVHMPGLSGVEALQRIRRGEAGPSNAPVVAFTADAMEEDVAGLLAAGFDAVLSKPIVPRQLADTLLKALVAQPSQHLHGDAMRSPDSNFHNRSR